jgi:hypothetical protein
MPWRKLYGADLEPLTGRIGGRNLFFFLTSPSLGLTVQQKGVGSLSKALGKFWENFGKSLIAENK